jgi:hypothetical protein
MQLDFEDEEPSDGREEKIDESEGEDSDDQLEGAMKKLDI